MDNYFHILAVDMFSGLHLKTETHTKELNSVGKQVGWVFVDTLASALW